MWSGFGKERFLERNTNSVPERNGVPFRNKRGTGTDFQNVILDAVLWLANLNYASQRFRTLTSTANIFMISHAVASYPHSNPNPILIPYGSKTLHFTSSSRPHPSCHFTTGRVVFGYITSYCFKSVIVIQSCILPIAESPRFAKNCLATFMYSLHWTTDKF